ncbi:hypothetical protein LTR91_023882 [Friedmanniomyces endolithicus]|uniref:GED domain-containing protein n=1 Tax=Friedmanniomyces endolithicus TaxID=329885 RepID=A0AAN6K111_9PEZI|nr:hypothetical protein LTR35_018042 [Friedmanniomyces endolithicus]KAK0266836.1 hypothetical protein LTS00_017920 [Friedmanniomyces endolithicus]KAK0301962.1 hypothetical protein LTR82_018051 [Friedmanniomyces endolithicus]KAK0302176.1 hypothetical protein LTR01_008910 [Friedmanniomyces endolithicus]KAK0822924.1 hypothetical protein LTR73_008926 [Friedmanniomyces endolithicus]
MREKGQSFKQTNSKRAPKLETTSPVDKKNEYWATKKKKNTPMAWPVDDTPPVQDACDSTTRLYDFVPSIQAQEIGEVLHGRDSRANGQVYIIEAELKAWVRETYLKTRGRELPGSYNHVLLTELFHHQSRRWPQIAGNHVDAVHDSIVTFVEHAVAHLKVEDHVHSEIYDGMNTKLQDNKAAAERELHQLCVDEQQHPNTFNHYYTDNVQKSRIDQTHRMLELALSEVDFDDGSGFANNVINPATVLATLQKHVTVNMDEQACSEALDGLNAYYKVALKTFVDNVCRQVIERHLLANLSDLLSPREVAGYADDELTRIAGERPDVAMKRRQWQEQLETFQAGLKDLRKDTLLRRPSGSSHASSMSPIVPALGFTGPDQPCAYNDDSHIPFASDGNAPLIRGSVEKVRGTVGRFTGIKAVRKTIIITNATASTKRLLAQEAKTLYFARHQHVVHLVHTYFQEMDDTGMKFAVIMAVSF